MNSLSMYITIVTFEHTVTYPKPHLHSNTQSHTQNQPSSLERGLSLKNAQTFDGKKIVVHWVQLPATASFSYIPQTNEGVLATCQL